MKMFIDCDPGVDDSIAILFALCRPDVEIVGISTSMGNCSAAQGAENAMRLIKLAGKEGQIPVCIGADRKHRLSRTVPVWNAECRAVGKPPVLSGLGISAAVHADDYPECLQVYL